MTTTNTTTQAIAEVDAALLAQGMTVDAETHAWMVEATIWGYEAKAAAEAQEDTGLDIAAEAAEEEAAMAEYDLVDAIQAGTKVTPELLDAIGADLAGAVAIATRVIGQEEAKASRKAGAGKQGNAYEALVDSDLYRDIPKAVFAAIAISALSKGGDYLEGLNIDAELAREWDILHVNGIVPQRLPSKYRTLAGEAQGL